jgi:hypothetical protein
LNYIADLRLYHCSVLPPRLSATPPKIRGELFGGTNW